MSRCLADRPLPAFEATSFQTEAGYAWATHRVCLGDHPQNHQNAKHVKPSQERKRERHADAHAAEELANASHLSTSSIAEEAVDKLKPKKPNETVE